MSNGVCISRIHHKMVVFICEACQESVRKPSVEKHAASCRACFVLTCVDCSVSFEGDAYRAHVTCVSEAQKYEGSLFKPKGGGKRDPQAEWLEVIAVAAEKETRHKDLLQRLLSFSNVPRKPKPFVAFAKNSLRVFNDRILEELFAAIQAHAPPRNVQPGREVSAGAVVGAVLGGGGGSDIRAPLALQGDVAVRAVGGMKRHRAEMEEVSQPSFEEVGAVEEGQEVGDVSSVSVWGRGTVDSIVAAAGACGIKASSLERAALRVGNAAGVERSECLAAVAKRVARLMSKGRIRAEGGDRTRYFTV